MMHVCRGNYHSSYANKGAYDSISEFLFARENVDAFYLQFDDERSGGFEPLARVSGNKKVVLGLVTTKRAELENKDKLIERIHAAAKYVPLDRLYLSPQCGFASCGIGNKLSEADHRVAQKRQQPAAPEQLVKRLVVRELGEDVRERFLLRRGLGAHARRLRHARQGVPVCLLAPARGGARGARRTARYR